MAVVKTARVEHVVSVGADSRLVQLRTSEPLGFTGGQFIIVDSGLTLPNGKAAKRAYSPITCDGEQLSFELVVKRIPNGPASGFMHALALGDEVRFSGPWGKMVPTDTSDGTTLVLASDTGITAALGLVRGERFARAGRWRGDIIERTAITPELAGRRIGIYGLGSIGTRIATRAAAFEMEVGYHNRRRRPDVPYIYQETLLGLAEWSDILV
ncbi:MAG TPA: NAD(P)-dependent oxidoreductase, partial [Polyangiales bacterium]|nr:NAD(P)-dependent oxidoreductase [Polyangiales bacterium]